MKEISVYTDGGCSGNPGPGGWAFVILSGDDKVLLSELYLYDFTDYIRETKGKFNNEPVTFVGYPSNTGHGGLLSMNSNFSILSNATDKDACWTLIKEFFKESDESDGSNYRGDFPSLKSDFYKLADESMKKPARNERPAKERPTNGEGWARRKPRKK